MAERQRERDVNRQEAGEEKLSLHTQSFDWIQMRLILGSNITPFIYV